MRHTLSAINAEGVYYLLGKKNFIAIVGQEIKLYYIRFFLGIATFNTLLLRYKMDYLGIDYIIIYAFLFITLVIGLRAGRSIKNVREYANGNKTFGTTALVATFLATDIAGESILDLTGEVGRSGIILAVVFIVGVGIAFMIQALYIAPKMIYFEQCITMGDVMETLYGTNSKIVTGLLGLFTAICVAGMDLTVMGLLCESLLGLDYRWGVGLGGFILAVYTAHGGIKAVAATDLFQLLIFLVVLPITVVVALGYAGGITTVLAQIPNENLLIINHPNFSFYLTLFLFKIVFHFYMIDPALIQRLLMAKTQRQLRSQFFIMSIFSPVIYVALLLLGLAGLVLYPNLAGVQVVPQIVNDLLPVGIKGLAIVGLFAVTMATVDSFLHAAGLTLVHDVVKPLCDKYDLRINELTWIKGATVIVSLFAISVGLTRADELYSLLFASIEFAGPLLAFPLFGGILGLKPEKRAFYMASWTTIIALLLAKYLLTETQKHLAVLISVVINGTVFLGIHALYNRGFALANRSAGKEYLLASVQRVRGPLATWIRLPGRIVKNAHKQVAQYGAPYMLFGLILIVYYIVSPFIWDHKDMAVWELMLYVRLLGALACGLLVIKDKWPQSLLKYLPTFWHFTLLYCLSFTSTVMFLLTQGSMEWLFNMTLTVMLLILLVDCGMFLILTVLGIILGFLFYQLTIGPIEIHLDYSTTYLLVYQGFFATLIGLLFARRKQNSFDTLATQLNYLAQDNQEAKDELLSANEVQTRFAGSLKKAGIDQLERVAHLGKHLLECIQKEKNNKDLTILAQQLADQLTLMALRMDRLVHRSTDFLRLDGVAKLSFDMFLANIQRALQERGYNPQIAVRTPQKTIQCDVEKMKKVFLNSFSLLRSGTVEEAPLLLGVEDTQLGYSADSVSPDHVKKVAALRFSITTATTLPKLEKLYMSQVDEAKLTMPEETSDLPLLTNERIVRAHYGYSSTISEGKDMMLLYVIPVNVREVRSKDMDTPQMQLGASWSRADDTYPGAQQQEQTLLQAVKERSQADLSLVEKAIELIKDYHGPILRKTGEPFYLHPIAVAQIVLDYNQDEATVLGALLHDTVEDTPLTLEQVALLFNKEVSRIIAGVTHMESNKETLYKVQLSHPENIHRLLAEKDQRVLYVKLADRMHNMRTIEAKSYESQRRTAEETLLFFVPLAKYLGLMEAAEELKERSWTAMTKVIQ